MITKAKSHLEKLCLEIPNRRVGSLGNRQATDWFAEVVSSVGFEISKPEFDCIDWSEGGAQLSAGNESFEVLVSPYTLGGRAVAQLVVISTIEELESAEIEGKVILLKDEITQEQLMPKNFVFYNPEHHQKIVRLLEEKNPAVIIAATTRNPELAGGMYPFPLIEDGDFDIPSIYMKDIEGERLANFEGQEVSIEINAERTPAKGCNVIAQKGEPTQPRIVFVAHIDAKDNTPGAIDNGTGIVILMLLAELLADYEGKLGVEILAVNGEDYYSAAGEMHYLQTQSHTFPEILLAVNMDGAGYHDRDTAYSLYNPPPEIADAIHKAFAQYRGIQEGAQWYQSDHSMFIQHQVSALAITSNLFMEQLAVDITHTPKDHPDIVEPSKLVDIAHALKALMLDLNLIWTRTSTEPHG